MVFENILENIDFNIPFFSLLLSFNLILRFSLKLGIIPFHTWVFLISKNLKWKRLIIFFSILKVIPLWGLFLRIEKKFLIFIVFLNLILFSFIPLNNLEIYFILSFSRILNSIWILLSIILSFLIFLYFVVVYIRATIQLLWFTESKKSTDFSDSSIFCLFYLMGFPPIPNFFVKLIILKEFYYSRILLILLILIFLNFISSIIYLKSLLLLILIKRNFVNSNFEFIFPFLRTIYFLVLFFK